MSKAKNSDDVTVNFDKTEVFKEQLSPLINQLIQICNKEHVPIFISVVTKDDSEHTEYANDGVLTGSMGINLHDNIFEKFLGVMHGGKVVFPGGEPDIPEDQLFDYFATAPSYVAGTNEGSAPEDEDMEEIIVKDREEPTDL